MQYEIDYHHAKYPTGTHFDIDNVSSENGMCTFSSIQGVLTYEKCLEKLEMADTCTTHAILFEPVSDEMYQAANEFVLKTEYLAYKIDGIIRIYKV